MLFGCSAQIVTASKYPTCGKKRTNLIPENKSRDGSQAKAQPVAPIRMPLNTHTHIGRRHQPLGDLGGEIFKTKVFILKSCMSFFLHALTGHCVCVRERMGQESTCA